MPNAVYLGPNFDITFDAMTDNEAWNEMTIKETQEDAMTKPAAGRYKRRAAKDWDAEITLRGFASDTSGRLKLATVHALMGKAPSALSITDDAGTPASQLRSDFFTSYPLAAWRVAEVNATINEDPAEWNVVLRPNYDTAARS